MLSETIIGPMPPELDPHPVGGGQVSAAGRDPTDHIFTGHPPGTRCLAAIYPSNRTFSGIRGLALDLPTPRSLNVAEFPLIRAGAR